MNPVAEILIPTHDHAGLLEFSLASALAQSETSIIVHVIGDGIGDDTRSIVRRFQETDSRVVLHDHPKSRRTGEEYRHSIVLASNARMITYLGDDDLMAPDHVRIMLELLENRDVCFPLFSHIEVGGHVKIASYSLEDSLWQNMYAHGISLFSLTGMSHTTDYYRRLPEGWAPTPDGIPTDMHMIQKFIAQGDARFGLSAAPTVVHFASSARQHLTDDERRAELRGFAQRLSSVDDWTRFRIEIMEDLRTLANARQIELMNATSSRDELQTALRAAEQRSDELTCELRTVERSRMIRLRNHLLRWKVVRKLARIRP